MFTINVGGIDHLAKQLGTPQIDSFHSRPTRIVIEFTREQMPAYTCTYFKS